MNSRDEWEPSTPEIEVSLGELLMREQEQWVPALTVPRMLDGLGFGNLCKLRDQGIYGREVPLATITEENTIQPVKWLRKKGVTSLPDCDFAAAVMPMVCASTGGAVAEIVTRGQDDLGADGFLAGPNERASGWPWPRPTRAA